MKQFRRILCALIILAIACSMSAIASEADGTATAGDVEAEDTSVVFSYSEGIDENGLWEGIKALECVELCDYAAIVIPSETHTISAESVQLEMDNMMANYAYEAQNTERAIADGDTVNIDYVGSIDGVEFQGGNTGGVGTIVTIGVTSYIDDFLEQLIGHMPGETFDIEVTFPENYGNDELNGKDAVFTVTLNYISETVYPELSDGFVVDNLSVEYGWTTIEEMKTGVADSLRASAIANYVQNYVIENTVILSLPDLLKDYEERAMLSYYQNYADSYGLALDDFISTYTGYATREELIAAYAEYNIESATFSLVMQALAEDAGISAGTAEVTAFFTDDMGLDDYAEYEAFYGLNYLVQVALCQTVLDQLAENAVLE